MEDIQLNIDKCTGQPIYKQIVDQLAKMVEAGTLHAGDKLPTGKELYNQYGISRGTVKFAYSQLSKRGLISAVQGKGVFVRGEEPPSHTIDVIDQYLGELTQIASLDEIELFVNQKIQERMAQQQVIKIAVIENCQEILDSIVESLVVFSDVEVTTGMMETILNKPEQFAQCDLIVSVEANIAHMVQEPPFEAMKAEHVPIFVSFEANTLRDLATISPGTPFGIFCRTRRYFEIIRWELASLNSTLTPRGFFLGGNGLSAEELTSFLSDKHTLLVANDPQRYATPDQLDAIKAYTDTGGRVISLKYAPDVGSILYMEECIRGYRLTHRGILL